MNRPSWKYAFYTALALAAFLTIGVAAVRAAASVRAKQIEEVVQSGAQVTYACQVSFDPSSSEFNVYPGLKIMELGVSGRICYADREGVPYGDAFTYLFGDRFAHSPLVYVEFMYHSTHKARQLTDRDVLRLKAFPTLERIVLDQATEVTDRGVAVVESLPNLERLFLYLVPITDRGLTSIATCKNLEYLSVHGDAITDDGLKLLAGLPRLQQLEVLGSDATGEFLASLVACPQLRSVVFRGRNADQSAIDRAKSLMPSVEIVERLRRRR